MTVPLDIGDTVPWITLETTRETALPLAELAGAPLAITAVPTGDAARLLATVAAPDVTESGGFWLILAPGADGRPNDPKRRLVGDADGTVRAALRLPGGDDPVTVVAGAGLRVRQVIRHSAGAAVGSLAAAVGEALRRAGEPSPAARAPALVLPDVLEPPLRQRLIDTWSSQGNEETGYLRGGDDGRLIHVVDPTRKRRRDHFLDERSGLARAVHVRVRDRVLPWIERAFHFRVGFAERYRIACYDAEASGFFAPHRDMNEASGYRHFAMSIALNDDYDGGALRFPEFGAEAHVPAAGAAIVYSGVLMHEVTPVTAGHRFVLVNFLTSREGAAEVARYQASHGAVPERQEKRRGGRSGERKG